MNKRTDAPSEPETPAAPRTEAGRLYVAYNVADDEEAGNRLGHLLGRRHWSTEDVVLAIEAEAAALAGAGIDLLAQMIDGDDSGNDLGHDRQTDDPGDGSGPSFCICGRWNDGDGITYGQHIAAEYNRIASLPTEPEE